MELNEPTSIAGSEVQTQTQPSPVESNGVQETEAVLLDPPKKPLWPIITLVMLVVATFVGWKAFENLTVSSETDELQIPDTKVSRLPVKTVRAEQAPIQRWVTSPDSEVQVERYKQLIFESSGEITYLAQINGRFLREGDRVQKGQLLARIDDREYNSNIRAAKADLEVVQRSQSTAIAGFNQAKANLEQAEADLELAKVEAKRRETLFKQGVIPETEKDTYDNRVIQAEVGVKVAKANLKSAQDQSSPRRRTLNPVKPVMKTP